MPDRNGTIVSSLPGPASTSGWSGGSTYVDNRTINITTGADPQAVVAALRRAKDLGMASVGGRRL